MEYAIGFNDILSIFYKGDNNKVFCKISKGGVWGIEDEIIDNCKNLISVSLVASGKIFIIIESLDNELILYSLINKEINKNVLINNMFLYDDIKIMSVKNTLNIFYTKKINNNNMLYHRTIKPDLTISMPFMLDIIDGSMEEPFLVSCKNDEIYIGYVKKTRMYNIGYRIFNVTKNKWTNFDEIEKVTTKINSFSIVRDEKIVFFEYIFNNKKIGYLKYGFKTEDIKKSSFIQDLTSIIKGGNLFIFDKKLYLSYATSQKVVISTLGYNKELSKIREIKINDNDIVKKYKYDCNEDNIDYIMVIEQDRMYSDVSLVYKEKEVREEARIKFSEVQGYNVDIDKLEEDNFQKQQIINKLNTIVNELKDKNNAYKEEIRKLTLENSKDIDEKFKIESNISSLYEEMLKRENTILALQNNISEYKNTIQEQKSRIEAITEQLSQLKDINKNLEDKYISFKSSNFKTVEEENIKLKNEIIDLNNKIQQINKELKKSNEKNKKLEDKYSSFKSSEFKIIEEENIKLKNEILDLNNNIQQINEQLKKSNEINKKLEDKYNNFKIIEEENTKLKNNIVNLNNEVENLTISLENKDEEELIKPSFFRKIFKDN